MIDDSDPGSVSWVKRGILPKKAGNVDKLVRNDYAESWAKRFVSVRLQTWK